MYLLTSDKQTKEGAYAVKDKAGEKVLFIFEQEDDAERYSSQLFSDHGVQMQVIEFDEGVAISACEMYNYKYSVITTNDFVIPPLQDDSVQKN